MNTHIPHRGIRLSAREAEVLNLVAAGHRSADVADILYVSKRTVDFHLGNVFQKLEVGNRVQAIRAAHSLGLIPFEPPFGSDHFRAG